MAIETLSCRHCICVGCKAKVLKAECPLCGPVVQFSRESRAPRAEDDDVPAWILEHSCEKMMVVIAHGSGRAASAQQNFDIPAEFQITTYTDNHDLLWSSEILQIVKHLEEQGVCPRTVPKKGGGTLRGVPELRQIVNFPLTFNDHNGLGAAINKPLGLYEANPGGGTLTSLAVPQSWSQTASVERVTKYALEQGYKEIVLLCCKGGDSNIQLLGRHTVEGTAGCLIASMPLLVGQSYPTLQTERLLCWRCREPFLPTKMQFSRCSFKLIGTERPSGSQISFPGLPEHGWCPMPHSQLVEVDYPKSGVMSLSLETIT